MEKFEKSKADYLPVVKNKVVIGLISKNALLESYREKFKNIWKCVKHCFTSSLSKYTNNK
jgi:hypothetical protein